MDFKGFGLFFTVVIKVLNSGCSCDHNPVKSFTILAITDISLKNSLFRLMQF